MLSVSELNEQAKFLLETHFENVEVEGEISRLTKHASGHWYFTLKDEKGSISCAMYRMNNARLKFEVKDSMKVIIYGKLSIYNPNGSYQLIASSMRPNGLGELELAFNQLKERLSNEGLFDNLYKKSMPKFPARIGLITSATSAALQDMLRIANERFKLSEFFVFDALTQGENAPFSLIKALNKADNFGLDVIILARGGGSREDLWCFNDENLAREIFKAKTPVISAIGHEIDYVISDFVADLRAPTPSAAITTLLLDMGTIFQSIDGMQNELLNAFNTKISELDSKLNLLKLKLNTDVIKLKIDAKISFAKMAKNELNTAFNSKISKLNAKINELKIAFSSHENFHKITKNLIQIKKDGLVRALNELKPSDVIELISQDTKKEAKII